MCSWYRERDYYWFTLKGIEKKDWYSHPLYSYTSGFSISHRSDSGLFHFFPSSVLKLKGLKYSRRWLHAKRKIVRIEMNYIFVKNLFWESIYFVISIIGQHSLLRISKVRCIHMYSFLTLAIKHSALKIFTHISKHSPFNSANSSLIAEERNKNQPSKPDSFHLVLNKSHYILTDIFIFKLWYDLYQLYKQLFLKSFSSTD